MSDDEGHHLAGDILAASASAIGNALAPIPHTRLEISSEVAFEGDAFDVAIYPTHSAPEGGEDFLVSGNIWLPSEQARDLVAAIALALERSGVSYQLELAIGQDVSATEVTRHAEYDAALAARAQRS
jgi:hypothetical protein